MIGLDLTFGIFLFCRIDLNACKDVAGLFNETQYPIMFNDGFSFGSAQHLGLFLSLLDKACVCSNICFFDHLRSNRPKKHQKLSGDLYTLFDYENYHQYQKGREYTSVVESKPGNFSRIKDLQKEERESVFSGLDSVNMESIIEDVKVLMKDMKNFPFVEEVNTDSFKEETSSYYEDEKKVEVETKFIKLEVGAIFVNLFQPILASGIKGQNGRKIPSFEMIGGAEVDNRIHREIGNVHNQTKDVEYVRDVEIDFKESDRKKISVPSQLRWYPMLFVTGMKRICLMRKTKQGLRLSLYLGLMTSMVIAMPILNARVRR